MLDNQNNTARSVEHSGRHWTFWRTSWTASDAPNHGHGISLFWIIDASWPRTASLHLRSSFHFLFGLYQKGANRYSKILLRGLSGDDPFSPFILAHYINLARDDRERKHCNVTPVIQMVKLILAKLYQPVRILPLRQIRRIISPSIYDNANDTI